MCFLHAAGLGTGFGTGFGLRMGFGLRTLAIDGKQPLLRPILALGTLSLVRTLPGITSCGHSMAFASGFPLAFCKAFRLCFQHTWANVLAISACAERANRDHDFNRFKVYPDRPETLAF